MLAQAMQSLSTVKQEGETFRGNVERVIEPVEAHQAGWRELKADIEDVKTRAR